MKRLLVSLFLLLAITGVVNAQVQIAKKDRVENVSPGYCAWCSIETLGRHHGVEKLVGLVEKRQNDSDVYVRDQWGRLVLYKHNAGYDWTIRDKLDKIGVKYRMSNTGSYDTGLLKYAVKNKLGCAVAVRSGALGDGAHALTLIDYNDKEVRYIDCNDKAVYTATRKWWDYWWDGWVLVILPEERKTDRVVAQKKKEEVKVEEAKVEQAAVLPAPATPKARVVPTERVPPIQWKYNADWKEDRK